MPSLGPFHIHMCSDAEELPEFLIETTSPSPSPHSSSSPSNANWHSTACVVVLKPDERFSFPWRRLLGVQDNNDVDSVYLSSLSINGRPNSSCTWLSGGNVPVPVKVPLSNPTSMLAEGEAEQEERAVVRPGTSRRSEGLSGAMKDALEQVRSKHLSKAELVVLRLPKINAIRQFAHDAGHRALARSKAAEAFHGPLLPPLEAPELSQFKLLLKQYRTTENSEWRYTFWFGSKEAVASVLLLELSVLKQHRIDAEHIILQAVNTLSTAQAKRWTSSVQLTIVHEQTRMAEAEKLVKKCEMGVAEREGVRSEIMGVDGFRGEPELAGGGE